MAAEELMNLKDASRLMGYSTVTTRRLVKRGVIPTVRLPGSRLLRFRPSTLRRVIEFSETGKGSAA